MTSPIVVVGAGLAGLAAAQALAEQGRRVVVLESRDRPGGRAGSFVDRDSGQLVDACQHVSMGCCTNLAHFCRRAGLAHLVAPQPTLFFMTADGRVSRFGADGWPAPLHLAGSFARAHYLTMEDKARIALGLGCLRLIREPGDPPFADWLRRYGQTPRTIERFWGLVLVSALNEEADRVGLRYARKVFVEGLMAHRDGFTVEVPTVPLGELYGPRLLASLNAEVRFNAAVRRIDIGERVRGMELRDGTRIDASTVVVAVPWHRVATLLPEGVASMPFVARLSRLEAAPITSVHLWTDRPLTELPHVVLVGCVGQWIFARPDNYLQVVISASRELRTLGHEETRRRIVAELTHLFGSFQVLRSRVVTEPMATFVPVPGVDVWRPAQKTTVPGLFLAGDWTRTGWPATMEGAVRSGYLAAGDIVGRRLVRADLQ